MCTRLRNRGTCFYVNIELKLRQCPVHNSSRTYTLLPVYYTYNYITSGIFICFVLRFLSPSTHRLMQYEQGELPGLPILFSVISLVILKWSKLKVRPNLGHATLGYVLILWTNLYLTTYRTSASII